MGASRSRGRSTAQNLPTSSDRVPLSSDGERATALQPGRTDPVAVLPRSARPYFWTVSLRETQYLQVRSASVLRASEAPFYGSFAGALVELHGSFPLARLFKNNVSLCETQYAEAGSGGLAPGRGVRILFSGWSKTGLFGPRIPDTVFWGLESGSPGREPGRNQNTETLRYGDIHIRPY
jgi:hypothetical protein